MMRDFETEPGPGSGGGGWSMRIMCQCHKCSAQEEQSVVKATWLSPVMVRQEEDCWLQTQLCPKCARWTLTYWIKVVWKLRIGRISDLFAPGYSHCGCCRTNWHFVEGHSTYVPDTGSGMFPLCEQCWAELTPAQRLPFYRKLYDKWPERQYNWEQLERAVLNEVRDHGHPPIAS
jgi:hypothetical protein